jgi:hypothetical protein
MSEKKYGLTVTFDIDLFTPCTKYEANLDGLDFPINIPLLNEESKLLFGENAAIADGYYQALHYDQKSGLYDSIKQALGQNFELMDIDTGSRMGIGYTPVGVMRNVALHGTYQYIVWLEVPSELHKADGFELIKKVAKVVNTELSRFEIRTGATALLSEVRGY